MGDPFPMLLTQEQLSLSASKVLESVCMVIRIVEFYAWTVLLIEDIDLFNLTNQEGNKSVNHAKNKSFV